MSVGQYVRMGCSLAANLTSAKLVSLGYKISRIILNNLHGNAIGSSFDLELMRQLDDPVLDHLVILLVGRMRLIEMRQVLVVAMNAGKVV